MLTPAGVRHQQHESRASARGSIERQSRPGLVLALGVGGFVTFTAFMPEYSALRRPQWFEVGLRHVRRPCAC